jgi:multiple sugar transport system ATP-binding protein
MNFLPARLEDNAGKLQVRLTDTIALAVPDARAARYRSRPRSEALTLGIRPEHITESRADLQQGAAPLDARPDVIEPMGMETLVYFRVGETDVCGRVNPGAPTSVGEPFRFAVDMNNMHLIDPATGLVI